MRCSMSVAGPSILLGAALGLLVPSGVHAQTEGRFSVGPQLTWHIPTGNDIDSSIGVGVAFSLTRPKNHDGWGPDFGFGWFSADLGAPLAGHLNTRPLLGGYGYTMVRGKYRIHFGALVGPAFAKIKVNDEDRVAWTNALGVPVAGVGVKNTWVFKPGARVTYNVHRRVGVFVGGEYERARLTLQVHTDTQDLERDLTADLINLKVGFSVGIF